MNLAGSQALRLYGSDHPVAQATTAQLGPLQFSVDGAQLRHLSLAGVEILRAAGLVIRDAWWGSHALEPSDSRTEVTSEQWLREVWGTVRDPRGEALLDWELTLCVQPRRVTIATQLLPKRDFTTCRAGLVLLHPLRGVVGAAVQVTHSDGQIQAGHFPDLISPGQPFFDICELAHSPHPRLRLHWRLSGDTFEMEDQRNWSDASFKTYSRPLAWPCPYVLDAAEPIEQRIELLLNPVGAQ